MSLACHCEAIDRYIAPTRARDELETYRRRGPKGTARLLLRMFQKGRVRAQSLLDIGAGVGVLHHELLGGTVASAVHVEAASAYLAAAHAEAERRGHSGRIRFLQGDFVSLAAELAQADLVTLDRVICCYPELEPLLLASTAKARRYWAASFPCDRWYMRLYTRLQNAMFRRAGNAFRIFVHPVGRIYELLSAGGFQPLIVRRGLVWEVALFTRQEAT